MSCRLLHRQETHGRFEHEPLERLHQSRNYFFSKRNHDRAKRHQECNAAKNGRFTALGRDVVDWAGVPLGLWSQTPKSKDAGRSS